MSKKSVFTFNTSFGHAWVLFPWTSEKILFHFFRCLLLGVYVPYDYVRGRHHCLLVVLPARTFLYRMTPIPRAIHLLNDIVAGVFEYDILHLIIMFIVECDIWEDFFSECFVFTLYFGIWWWMWMQDIPYYSAYLYLYILRIHYFIVFFFICYFSLIF